VLALMTTSLVHAESFFAGHSRRVRRSMFFFREGPTVLVEPAVRSEREKLVAAPVSPTSFVGKTADVDDLLGLVRQRDRLRLFRDERVSVAGLAAGASLFGATTVLAAHLPAPMRVIFDAPVHAGPSIFYDGGVGAAVGGAF
jgi:hypothetical protein